MDAADNYSKVYFFLKFFIENHYRINVILFQVNVFVWQH